MIIHHPSVLHSYSPVKVAFLTGLSNPVCCRLSREYHQFLSNLECPEAWKIYLNFPYVPEAKDLETEDPKTKYPETRDPGATDPGDKNVENLSLLKASLSNVQQFLGAQSPQYREAAQRHLASLFSSTEVLFLIVGSCGLEILNQSWTEAIAVDRVRIVALGPVARSRPWASSILIQGDRDYISRLFFQEVDVSLPNTGHMDYVTDRRVFELVSRSLWQTLSMV